MDFDAYLANVTAYEDTIRTSIAATMDGVTAEDVYDLVVTAVRRLALSFSAETQSIGDIAISYRVSVRNIALTYASLSNQLRDAVSSGLFDTILQSTAETSGATGLTTATSDAVSTVDTAPTAAPTMAPTVFTADTASFLSKGVLIAIIVAAVALIGLFAGFCCTRQVCCYSLLGPE